MDENWTTLSVTRETKELVEELATLITEKEDRFRACSKHEAVHKAVSEMIKNLRRRK